MSNRTDPTGAAKFSLKDVAERADVSEATVSRVLNRRSGVAQKTREAVEQAMVDLGYSRDIRGDLVMLIVPGISNPIFAEMCEEMETAFYPYGLRTVLCPVLPGSVQERDYVESMAESGVAAAVFLSSSNTIPTSDQSAQDILRIRGVPFVSVNGPSARGDEPVFSTDDRKSAHLGVQHLRTLGHTRIGMIAGPAGNLPADRQVEGFADAVAELGADQDDDLVVRTFYAVEDARQAVAGLLDRSATGIMAANDLMALGVIAEIRSRGLEVPGDVSVVGHDDSAILDYVDPPLTTVRQPIGRLAKHCAQAVNSLLTQGTAKSGEILFSPELRIRKSTAPVRTPRL